MDVRAYIAQHLLEVHEGNNWTEVDLTSTIKDITAEEANMVTQASPNTIVALLHHITYWNRLMVKRIEGVLVEIPASNGFHFHTILSEQEWRDIIADTIASAHELADAIRSIDPAKLWQPLVEGHTSGYRNLQGSVEHVHYHLGQIVMIKQLIRNTRN